MLPDSALHVSGDIFQIVLRSEKHEIALLL